MGLWVVVLNNLVILGLLARRAYREQAGYIGLLAGNLILAGWLLFSDNVDSPLSFVSIGAFFFMVVLPPFIDRAARKALADERIPLAIWLTGFRELLQPGAKVGRMREALEPMARVRRGEAKEVLAEIEEVLTGAEGVERKALEIQYLSVLLYDRRWRESVEFFEERLPAEIIAFHPPLASGIIRAFGELGYVHRMTAVMGLLEDSPGLSGGGASEVLDGARMVFLAFCGRYEELKVLLGSRSGFAQTTDEGTRLAWLGIAAKTGGDKAESKNLMKDALAKMKGASARKEINRHLELLEDYEPPLDELKDESVKLQVQKVLERAAVKYRLPRVRGGSLLKIAPATSLFVVISVVAWFGMEIIGGGSGDPPTLVNWGANMKEAVRGGQYYRLISSVFLHAHWAHLGLNMFVLAILGRMAEQIVGTLWFIGVFVLSGVVGSVASFLFGEAPLSVGASGAIFGVLGAMIAALATGKGRWPDAWRRSLMTILLILGGLSLLPGLQMKVIDNWAHIGGLVGGALVGGMAWIGQYDLSTGFSLLKIEPDGSENGTSAGGEGDEVLEPVVEQTSTFVDAEDSGEEVMHGLSEATHKPSRSLLRRWISVILAAVCLSGVVFSGVRVASQYNQELPWVNFGFKWLSLRLPASWVLDKERSSYVGFQSVMSRERLMVYRKEPGEGALGSGSKAGCVEVFSKEVEEARKEAQKAGSLERRESSNLLIGGQESWHQQTFVHRVKGADLAHGIYVRQFDSAEEMCVVVHYLCLAKESGKARSFLSRFLASVRTRR